MWLGIEYAWLKFPSTVTSSLVLLGAHSVMVAGLAREGRQIGWAWGAGLGMPVLAAVVYGVRAVYAYGGLEQKGIA